MIAPRPDLVRSFGALIPLQPVRWTDEGLLCVPDMAPDPIWECPFPTVPAPRPAVAVSSPARLVAGWYRRSTSHAPAPPGFPEIVQADGDGFGPADHPTTAMCLSALGDLPDGEAVDVGCGSGLLTLAWAASGRGPVTGVDANPAAGSQARRSATLTGLAADLFHAGRIEALPTDHLRGRILLANLPPVAHDALAARMAAPPRAAVVSGFTRRDRERVLSPYLRRGMRRVRTCRGGRYECHVLRGAA